MKYINYSSGIYKIVDITNEILYVGQAVDFNARYKTHLGSLKRGTHESAEFQKYANKIGIDNLLFVVVEPCRVEHLDAKEAFYIKRLRPLFNYCHIEAETRIVNYSDDQKKFIGAITEMKIKKEIPMSEIIEMCDKNDIVISTKMIGMLMPKLGFAKIRKRQDMNRTYFVPKN
jgi:group I intron endonuclease